MSQRWPNHRERKELERLRATPDEKWIAEARDMYVAQAEKQAAEEQEAEAARSIKQALEPEAATDNTLEWEPIRHPTRAVWTNRDFESASGLVDLGEAITPETIKLKQEPLSTGIPAIDAALGGGFTPGELTIIQAGPGAGKTTLTLMLQCDGVALAKPRVGLYVTTEMQPDELQARRACQLLNARGTRCNWRDVLTGKIDLETTRSVTKDTGIKVLPVRPSGTPIEEIKDAAIKLACLYEGKSPVIVCDYLQGLSLGFGDDRRLAVGKSIYDLQSLAVELKTPIIAISSTGRLSYGTKDKRESENPLDFLSASKEAGEIEYAAATVIHLDVKPDEDEHGWREARFIVCKSRFGRLGITGLRFHGASGRFEPNVMASLTELDRKVLEIVNKKSVSSANDVAEHLKKNRPAVLAAVRKLRGLGTIKTGPNGAFFTSVLTDQFEEP